MKKIIVLLICNLLVLHFRFLYADQSQQWIKTYDSTRDDCAYDAAVDSNDNIIVVGDCSNGTDNDFHIIKYDPDGGVAWSRDYDTGGDDHAAGVAVDSNDNIIVSGWTCAGTNYNFLAIKYDKLGNPLKIYTYDSGNNSDYGQKVAVDSNNNIFFVGYCDDTAPNNYFRTIKFAPDGSMVWNKTYSPNPTGNEGWGVAVDSNNNIVICGSAFDGDNDYIYLIKYDNSGNFLWPKSYDSGGYDAGYDVAIDTGNNIIVTGYYKQDGVTPRDMRTIKYDPDGNILWNKTYDGGDDDYSWSVDVDCLSNIVIAGDSNNGANRDFRVIKYDPSGNIIWNETYDEGVVADELALGVAFDSKLNVIVTGRDYSGNPTNADDFCTIKYKEVFYIKGYVKDSGASAISGVTVSLSGDASNEDTTDVTGYYEFLNLSFGNYTVTPSSSGWGFVPSQKYYVQLATNQVNQDFTGYLLPTTPSGFSGDPISSSEIKWSWTDSANEDGYYIYTSTNGIIVTLSANTTYWPETGLLANTQYARYVNAYNPGGSADSNSDSVYTLASVPSSLISTGQTKSSINLGWSGDGTRYAIERAPDVGGSPGSWTYIKQWSDNISETVYTDTGLSETTTYWYRVKAYNGDQAITGPSNELSVLTSNSAPSLTWTGEANYASDGLHPETGDTGTNFVYRVKYTDEDNDAPATGYPRVYIQKGGLNITGSPFTMSAADGNPYSSGRKFSFTISGLSEGTDYTYYFEAKDCENADATGSPTNPMDAPDVLAMEEGVGYIVGRVRESDGTPVLNAKVEAKQNDNLKGSALTDANGQFTISDLKFGKYDVVASKEGYESEVKTGISISESETTAEVNLILRVMKKDMVIPYDNLFDPDSGEYATIKYNVLQGGNVDMKILDSRGREIKTLVTGHKSSGSYVIIWNGKDDNGKKVGSGIYLIQLKTNRGSIIKKIAVVK